MDLTNQNLFIIFCKTQENRKANARLPFGFIRGLQIFQNYKQIYEDLLKELDDAKHFVQCLECF